MQKIMKSPRTVDIDITNRCNLRCSYCYHFSSPGDVDADLPTEEWLTFFAELGRLSVMDVTLAGGEPFFRKDLRQIIQGIVDNRMRYAILSNGTLIDDDMVAFIKSTKRCNYVQLSIDGSRPETHDVFRGPGALEKAIRGIRTLQKHGVSPAVRVTIHRHNVHDLENIARLLLEDLGLPSFGTNAASYMGLCQLNEQQVGMNLEERMLAMRSLVRLNEKYDGRIQANAGPLADARMWAEMEQARKTGKPLPRPTGRLTACGCVFDKIAIRADGVIVPCTMLSHIELGRINRDDLGEIWRNHPDMVKMHQRMEIPLTNFEFCHDCPYIDYCTGNCPGLAYTLTGQVDHPSPESCLRRFLQQGGRL